MNSDGVIFPSLIYIASFINKHYFLQQISLMKYGL